MAKESELERMPFPVPNDRLTDEQIEMLKHVEVLRLQPGDVIVLCAPEPLEEYEIQRIKDRLGPMFEGHRVVVLDGGARLGAVRPDVAALKRPFAEHGGRLTYCDDDPDCDGHGDTQ